MTISSIFICFQSFSFLLCKSCLFDGIFELFLASDCMSSRAQRWLIQRAFLLYSQCTARVGLDHTQGHWENFTEGKRKGSTRYGNQAVEPGWLLLAPRQTDSSQQEDYCPSVNLGCLYWCSLIEGQFWLWWMKSRDIICSAMLVLILLYKKIQYCKPCGIWMSH